MNGEIINTEIAILGTKKNLSDSEKTAVKVVQLKLNEVKNAGLAVDGSYGSFTTGAAQYFQEVLKLPANGVMDTKTFTLLQHHYEYMTSDQISNSELEYYRRMFELVTQGTGYDVRLYLALGSVINTNLVGTGNVGQFQIEGNSLNNILSSIPSHAEQLEFKSTSSISDVLVSSSSIITT